MVESWLSLISQRVLPIVRTRSRRVEIRFGARLDSPPYLYCSSIQLSVVQQHHEQRETQSSTRTRRPPYWLTSKDSYSRLRLLCLRKNRFVVVSDAFKGYSIQAAPLETAFGLTSYLLCIIER